MKTRNFEAEMGALDELHQKYKFMETNLQQRRAHLEAKVPELKNNIDVLEKLKAHQVRHSLSQLRAAKLILGTFCIEGTICGGAGGRW